MFRSPGVFLGYYKNPEATAETLEDGWVHSGDAGYIDAHGHLKIIDRARDVSRVADANRSLFAPRYLENKLKFSPFIKEAVVHGQERPFVGAFINIDLDAVGNWAERRGLAYTSYTDLRHAPRDLRPHPGGNCPRQCESGGGATDGRGADPALPHSPQGTRPG